MMMETMYDPYDLIYSNEQTSPNSEELLFTNEIMLGNYNNDSASISPLPNTFDNAETEFDPVAFEAFLNDFLSSDQSMIQEQSMDLPLASLQTEPTTREMGTDPMEPISIAQPITITSSNITNNSPIILIRTTNGNEITNTLQFTTVPLTTSMSSESYNLQQYETSTVTTNDNLMEDILSLTPSSTSESNDEIPSNSPESTSDHAHSKLLTNFDKLPNIGPLVLTNEEVKLIKQEGYQVPNKLPLNRTEERMLKKIRRKIKNKISAQESRRKKKEYVDALEKQIAKYVDENSALKERMAIIEKNHKKLAQERDLLRSMMNKATPGSSTVLMAFAIFFAVALGFWAPFNNKSAVEDRSLSLENSFISSNNYQSSLTTQKSLFEQQESTHSNYLTDKYKSRVLLSADENENHHYGPYLPSKPKYQSSTQQQSAAPGYTFPYTVEKYMNKKVKSQQSVRKQNEDNLKRSLDYQVQEDFVFMEQANENIDNVLNRSKPVKIIRVERATPAFGNDTSKLAHQAVDK